jgi:hypothetical protein
MQLAKSGNTCLHLPELWSKIKDERKVSRSAQDADHLIGRFFGSKKANDGCQEQRRRYNHNKEV